MGVPALFRWLSKKYPKIILPVIEDEEQKVPGEGGNEVTIPVDITQANPNGMEFDNLYLDMNGIVHPCTHPEGKPAPETEEDMMLEIFSYTERVVNMVRPRKLLFMAIDGVAPRAKMNQQRSRRFRAAQEAKDKEEARQESFALWESMGKTISEEERNKKSWDSNAITPGTPFMDLLAASLRYWVTQKINTDPGWKKVQVYISDASVPGEGEHKIMDFIRRQRSNPGHDPNTKHVIYGLDADLIMLSLATHEPNFRVLREDVFQQSENKNACRNCGQEGHYAAQCTNAALEKKKDAPVEKKPFIFLDVATLREYLESELDVPQVPFPFSLEQAIDDWVLLIFFVGNDFLPHLPSLEIREGAIDTLLKIWRTELPRMGGYLTNHGQLELSRVQIILDGLAQREDDIFRRRREMEERQDQNTKRRKLEAGNGRSGGGGPSPALQLTSAPTAPHPSLPAKPVKNDFAGKADAMGFGNPSIGIDPAAASALGGSNRDIVAQRAAIRLANMNAAELLKSEMGLMPVKASANKLSNSLPPKPVAAPTASAPQPPKTEDNLPGLTENPPPNSSPAMEVDDDSLPGLNTTIPDSTTDAPVKEEAPESPRGHKRPFEEMKKEDAEAEDENDVATEDIEEEEEEQVNTNDTDTAKKLVVRADGSVDQEDTVKLWEPGYRDRYYKQKFNVDYNETEFRKAVTKSYVEGMAWVLHYYYQGPPAWKWFYPYHFAPFAHDFEDLETMDIKFNLEQPSKPFEQLMGVFPAASRVHIPEVFHSLMTQVDSPIIDFYPETFEIDMNGKKMLWQGVALLPFIDEKRLLDAMAEPYKLLTEDEHRRNTWGNNVVFIGEQSPLYPLFESLYGKRKDKSPVPMDPKHSGGINGTVLPNPDCLPGSTYYSPLTSVGQPDIRNDRALSALYFFPKQLSPHRSVLLPGVSRLPRILTSEDLDRSRRGGRGRGSDHGGRSDRGGRGRGMLYGGSGYQVPNNYGHSGSSSGGRGGGYNSRPHQPYQQQGGYGGGYGGGAYDSRPQQQQGYGGYNGGYGGGNRPQSNYSSQSYGGPPRGGPPSRGGPPAYGSHTAANGRGGAPGYGGYGGYGASSGQGYGGQGGYGGNGANGGYNQGYGGGGYNNRGRGRGGRY